MSQKPDRLIRELWPLPGGNQRYLHTLDRVLKWAAGAEDPTADETKSWLMAEYNVTEGSASGYLRVVKVLGAVDISRNGKVTLSSLGKKIIDSKGEAKARIVIERFVQDYLAFRDVLAVYAQADDSIHLSEMVETLQPQFPRWTTEAQFEYRALWLLSLGCLRQVRGRHYEITELGKTISNQFPPDVEIKAPAPPRDVEEQPTEIEAVSATDEVAQIIAELVAAATDSQNPERLERAVAGAFDYLGFAVDQLGEPGDTDVLAKADIGPESYTVIADAKARRDGKLHSLEVYTLQEHLRNNEADFAAVVAGRFATGKVARHAKENGVVLFSVPLLSDWLRLHARTPLNLSDYRVMFTTPGVLPGVPTALNSAADKREQWAHLLVDLIELINETYEHGLIQSLPGDQLFAMLITRLRGVRYPKQQVLEAIELLTHPAVGAALGDGAAGISLVMNRTTLVRALRALANLIETAEAETEA